MQNDCWLPWQQRASNPGPSKVMVAVRACVRACRRILGACGCGRSRANHTFTNWQTASAVPSIASGFHSALPFSPKCVALPRLEPDCRMHEHMPSQDVLVLSASASRLRLQLESATKTISMVQFSPDSESLAVVLYNEMQVKSFP
jgi:hypothetical protein